MNATPAHTFVAPSVGGPVAGTLDAAEDPRFCTNAFVASGLLVGRQPTLRGG